MWERGWETAKVYCGGQGSHLNVFDSSGWLVLIQNAIEIIESRWYSQSNRYKKINFGFIIKDYSLEEVVKNMEKRKVMRKKIRMQSHS